MTLRKISVAALTALVALICWTASAAEHAKDSLDQVKKGLADGQALLIDVREADEWADGHLEDASPLPLSELPAALNSGKVAMKYPKTRILYIHCAAGGRCLKAADDLQKAGYDVRPLKQGYAELLKNGFPKAKEK